ncbi:unnamed protein product [Closterium sp. NIES-65]|nr:unnamed protein product [Closterium sp. NIES-65]
MEDASPAESAPAPCASSADPSAPLDGAGPPAAMAEAAEDLADLLVQGARHGDLEYVAAETPLLSGPPFGARYGDIKDVAGALDAAGTPPLPFGARYGDVEDVAAALDGGADAGLADDEGRTGGGGVWGTRGAQVGGEHGERGAHRCGGSMGNAGRTGGGGVWGTRGAQVEGDEGRTALHMAAANGHTEIARLLIQRGALPAYLSGGYLSAWECRDPAGQHPVNAVNRQGNTPLHWAAVNGRDSMVHLLIAAGASPSALNSHERTPVDEAIHSNNQHTLDAINAALATRDAASLTVGGSQGDDTRGDGDGGDEATDIME